MGKRNGNLALGGLLLAGLGYLAGILTAPKSGKETRKDIQRSAVKAKQEAEKKLKQAHAELSDLVDKGKKSVQDMSAKAKEEVSGALEKAQIAKDRARAVLSAVHEGESDDKELQKAVDEANKAVDHLKKYITKHAVTKKTK